MQLLPLLAGPVMLVAGLVLLAWAWDREDADGSKGCGFLLVFVGVALTLGALWLLHGLRHGPLFL